MALEQFLAQWGLPAIFAGTLAEGEGVAIFGGVLAHRGLFPYEYAALAAAAGAFVIDQAVFQIGRHASRFAMARRMLDAPRAQSLLARLAHHPLLFCLGFRFVWGLKTLGALALGAAGVAPMTFLALDLLATLLWGHAMTALGFLAGQGIERVLGRLALHHHLAVAVLALVAVAAVAVVFRHLRHLRR